MPFKSLQQMKFLYAKHPKIAKKWTKEQEKTQGKGSFKRLPKKVKSKDYIDISPKIETLIEDIYSAKGE